MDVVPAEPAASFPERCCAAVAAAGGAGQQYDAVYLSQTIYLSQHTLIPSIPDLVKGLRAAAAGAAQAPAQAAGGAGQEAAEAGAGGGACQLAAPDRQQPLIIIDGYHGFCALPTDLSEVAEDCCYVAGLLKHAGCGANCAFMTLPARLAARPVLTGWLADPSVLAPGSSGIHIGSEVDGSGVLQWCGAGSRTQQQSSATALCARLTGCPRPALRSLLQVGYSAELALQGSTPSYLLPLLTFNHLQQLWQGARPALTVEGLHRHVITLHQRFLEGLDAGGHPSINSQTLLPPQVRAPTRAVMPTSHIAATAACCKSTEH